MWGVVAAAAALAAVGAGALARDGLPFPPLALAERAIRLAPGDLATFAIERLGHLAVPLLSGGAVAAFLIAGAALAGGVASPARGAAFFGALAAASLLAAPIRPSAVGLAVSVVLAAAAFALVLAARPSAPAADRGQATPASPPVALASRRSLLLGTAGLIVAGAAGGRVLGALTGSGARVQLAAVDAVARPPQRASFPAVPGLSAEVTSPEDHYVVDIDVIDPSVDAAGWQLRVNGLVTSPLELDLTELQRTFRIIEQYSSLTCISNEVGGPLVGNSLWTGVQLREVIGRVEPREGASGVVFSCADGYTVSVPLERALAPDAMLAFGQGRRPLTRAHGSPCRVRLPALYGMMNAKWLERIELVEGLPPGYWAKRGWSPTGEVRTQSRIDTISGTRRAGAELWVAGVAWAGERGLTAVEISFDDGRSWEKAERRQPLSRVAWTQWAIRWRPARQGLHTVSCRAVEEDGIRQIAGPASPHPAGATGYHQVEVEIA